MKFGLRFSWDSSNFPREMFRQSKSLAGGQGNEYLAMHTKVCIFCGFSRVRTNLGQMCIRMLSDPPKKKDTMQAKGKTKSTTFATHYPGPIISWFQKLS